MSTTIYDVVFMYQDEKYDGGNYLYDRKMSFIPRVGDIVHLIIHYLDGIKKEYATHDNDDEEYAWRAKVTDVEYNPGTMNPVICHIRPISDDDLHIQRAARVAVGRGYYPV